MLKQEPIVIEQKGAGQPLIIIFEAEARSELPFYLIEQLMNPPLPDCRTILISLPKVSDIGCLKLTKDLINFLDSESIKQASFIGFGHAGAVLQNLAIAHLKRVRRIILVDSPTRPHPNLFEKAMSKVEKFLPLGLPFRSTDKAFDSRSFLQRIRAPALIVSSSNASPYEKEQAKILADSMATAWSATLSRINEREEFRSLLVNFYLVPAKRPQKNRAA